MNRTEFIEKLDALSEEILLNKVSTGQKVNVDVKDGAFVFQPVK